jgi:hypothetical protein
MAQVLSNNFLETCLGLEDHHQGQLVAQVLDQNGFITQLEGRSFPIRTILLPNTLT